LPNEITVLDTVKALFVRSFGRALTMEYLDSPRHAHAYTTLLTLLCIGKGKVLNCKTSYWNYVLILSPWNISTHPGMHSAHIYPVVYFFSVNPIVYIGEGKNSSEKHQIEILPYGLTMKYFDSGSI
jgi:hypothetical protein